MPPLKVGECMIEKVKNTMNEHYMFPTHSVLVGLSGGADSVALLHIMHELSKQYGFRVYSAHVNHGLRGDDAVHDAEFSKKYSKSLGIECFVKNTDIRAIAQKMNISEEMAGRSVRYEFFAELMDKYNIEFTATAHHKNDNAETIMMNFMRGSSLAGLCGIPYRRERFIRPILDVSRHEIERYCAENSLNYVTDETNLKTVYTRNKIRNILIPEIEREFNPNFCDTITSNAKLVRADADFLVKTAKDEYERVVTDKKANIKKLMLLHKAIAGRIIRMMIDSVCGISDVSSAVVDGVYNICKSGKTGAVCNITKGVVATIEYGSLVIGYTKEDCPDFLYEIKVGEKCYIPQLGYTIVTEYADKTADDGAEYFALPDGVNSIIITNRRKGDRFHPSGMDGTKSVKEYMINEKIPQYMRSRIGIMRVNDKIAWIIGYRRDKRFRFQQNGIKIKIIY